MPWLLPLQAVKTVTRGTSLETWEARKCSEQGARTRPSSSPYRNQIALLLFKLNLEGCQNCQSVQNFLLKLCNLKKWVLLVSAHCLNENVSEELYPRPGNQCNRSLMV